MKKLLILGLVGIVLASGAWFGRSAYRGYKEKRAVKQAGQFLEKNEFAKAMLSTRQALQYNPNNLDACRIMAALAEAGGSPHALEWRKRVAELEPTLDNQLILASCALRFESIPFPTTQSTLQKIGNQATNQASYHVVASQLALQLNNLPVAERHLSEAVRLNPTNENNRLNLAAVQVRSQDSAKAAQARRTLEALRSNPQVGNEALRWLLRDRADHGDDVAALRFSEQLVQQKDVPDTDRFQHLTLLQRINHADLAPYLRSLQAKAGTNAVEIYKIAAWQIASDQPSKALAWLATLPPALQRENPVPVARADALAAMKRWNELTDYLRAEKWNEQEFLRLALLAHALKEQKEADAAQATWSRAVRIAMDNAEHLSVLTQLSGKWGWERETEALLWQITEKYPTQTWALESINRVYEANRNTAGLLRVFETKLQRNGSDNVSRNNVAMLSMLLRTNLASAYGLAEKAYQLEPKSWGIVSTYAYALHSQGKTAEGLKLMEGLGEAELKRPEVAFYYALLLKATGQTEKAQPYLALAQKAQVLPEEKKLL